MLRSTLVAKTLPDPLPVNRYDRIKIGQEVINTIAAFKSRGLHTRIAEYMGMSSQQLTHRLQGESELKIEEAGCIADFLKAPAGWPFRSWTEATGGVPPDPEQFRRKRK